MKTIDILQKLISIPSFVNTENNEVKLLEFIKEYLTENTNLNIVEQPVEAGRYNIIASKKENPKVALFGHTDTVLPQKEMSEPFNPRIEGTNLYGLGSVDMKAGLAVMLTMATEFKSDDLALVFSVDEEYDFKGAQKLKILKNFNPEFIINIEPTDNKILNGCRGITEFSFVVHGKSAHAGRKKFGINAIEKGVELIKVFQREISKLDSIENGKSSVNLAYIHGGTLQQSSISGLGMIVPNYAEMNCEIRIANPKITEEFVVEALNRISSKLKITLSDFNFKFLLGSMFTAKKDLSDFEKAIKTVGQQVEYGDISLAGFYEVQLLQQNWKSKSVVFGPGPVGVSHSVNEYVDLKSLEVSANCIREYLKNNLNLTKL